MPDVLKLARGVEDALTGIVWRDDAQIVNESLNKVVGAAAPGAAAGELGAAFAGRLSRPNRSPPGDAPSLPHARVEPVSR